MKKTFFLLLISFASLTVHAQLQNTKWKGTIQADNTLNVVFDYRSDTLEVTNTDDGSNIETMTYAVKNNVMTLKKVYGKSACDETNTGKYKFDITGNTLHLTQVADSCKDRTSALSNSRWIRMK